MQVTIVPKISAGISPPQVAKDSFGESLRTRFILYCNDAKNPDKKIKDLCGEIKFSHLRLAELDGGKSRSTFDSANNTAYYFISLGKEKGFSAEKVRRGIQVTVQIANELKAKTVSVSLIAPKVDTQIFQALAESAELSNYQFNKYLSEPKVHTLEEIQLYQPVRKDSYGGINKKSAENSIHIGLTTARCANITRDLVNEPVIELTATELANRAVKFSKQFGFSAEVLDKKKIESLKMGGLLAVNYGSELPPAFIILEYKGKGAKNKKPVVLVGKGIVFDTGGLSLKPTSNSMDHMKTDMAGAAAVIGTFCATASLKLPVHIIGLIPATDNRPGKNAYTPGDVIRMHSGKTVEVLNTDAEGRMVLADALSYAKNYSPELVIDLATLTGAVVAALGTFGIGMMSTAKQNVNAKLKASGEKTYERLVEFPLWEEYDDQIKSEIADLKNIGNPGQAGTIIGGKFLEHFTAYPWIHLDIAGMAFMQNGNKYQKKGATGVGVRLLTDFLRNY